MPIKDHKKWKEWVEKNKDPYGGCCIRVARKAMEIIDRDYYGKPIGKNDATEIVTQADHESGPAFITGYMAGAVASMVAECHDRGEDFRKSWNNEIAIGDEGEKANKSGGVLNPALLNIGAK